MYGDHLSNDYWEIISGTTNRATVQYMEAKETETSRDDTMKYMKKFITSIEKLAGEEKVKDNRISSSKGKLDQLSFYENLTTVMDFFQKHLSKNGCVKQLKSIQESIKKYESQYTEGYSRNIHLVELEYENAVYLLITGCVYVMANYVEQKETNGKITVKAKESSESGALVKTIGDFAKELSSEKHKEYLKEILSTKPTEKSNQSIKESVYMEEGSYITQAIDLIGSMWGHTKNIVTGVPKAFKAVKRSVFGIIPLIRSVLYLRYKRKADHIVELENQAYYIRLNIEQLENMTTMDPKKKASIIKKQKAKAEQMEKKAAKLRAQMTETDREATEAIEKDNKEIESAKNEPSSKSNSDDDFVLESMIQEANEEFSDILKKCTEFINVISNNDQHVLNEFMEYWNKSSEHNLESAWWEAFEIVTDAKYIMALDWKFDKRDYLYNLDLCFKKRNIPINISSDAITSDESLGITYQLNQILQKDGIQLVFIDTDADEYILIPYRTSSELNQFIELFRVGNLEIKTVVEDETAIPYPYRLKSIDNQNSELTNIMDN